MRSFSFMSETFDSTASSAAGNRTLSSSSSAPGERSHEFGLESDEVITRTQLDSAPVPRLRETPDGRRWVLAVALLVSIMLVGFYLMWAVVAKKVTVNDALALAGILITPLLALLGTTIAFYYR